MKILFGYVDKLASYTTITTYTETQYSPSGTLRWLYNDRDDKFINEVIDREPYTSTISDYIIFEP